MKSHGIFQTFLLAILLLLLCGARSNLVAQRRVDVAQVPVSFAPYAVGERLTYNVAFSSYATAAHIEMTVARNAQTGATELHAHVETLDPVYVALYPLNRDYVSTFDPSSAAFGEGITYDLLTAVYRVRALPLQMKQKYRISVRDESGQVYDAEFRVIGTERIGTLAGAFETLIAEVHFRGESRLRIYDPIHHQSHLDLRNLRVYFSNDERHLPVRLTAQIDKSDLRVNLASVELPPAAPPMTSNISQPAPPNMSLSVASSNALPFNIGEQLNYNFFLAGTVQPVGTATLQAQRRADFFNRTGLLLTGVIETTGAGACLFPVRDQINSYVDPVSLLPFRSEINLSEGARHDSWTIALDQERGAANFLNASARIEIPVGTYDYLSALYALRRFDLTPPKRTALALLVNGRPRTFYVTALRRETIELDNQRINAIQVSITTDDPNPDKNYLRLWISADKRRLPLRLTANTPLGTLRADLAIIPLSNQ